MIDRPGGAPSSARDAMRDFAPFGGAVVLAWITVPIASSVEWTQYLIATTLLLVAVVLRFVLVRWTDGRALDRSVADRARRARAAAQLRRRDQLGCECRRDRARLLRRAAQRGESSEDVIARADAALYDAKAAGRDRACLSA
jgi:hypothetical protein